MTPGRKWNEMATAERARMLIRAEFKPETIAKYAPMRWSDIERCYRPCFTRVMYATEPGIAGNLPEQARNGEW